MELTGGEQARIAGPDGATAPHGPGVREGANAPSDPVEAAQHRQDLEWIRRVRAGDVDAFGHLVEAHAGRLHGLLWRFLRDDDDVADVAQEALVRAFRSLDRYDATRPFYPWLRRIAVNLALNELAKRKVRRPVEDAEELLLRLPDDGAAGAANAPAEQRELAEAVEQALQAIPVEFAAVFRLRVHEDLSYAEIAETMDIPIGSVMSRLSRARARLAQALAARFGPHHEALP